MINSEESDNISNGRVLVFIRAWKQFDKEKINNPFREHLLKTFHNLILE